MSAHLQWMILRNNSSYLLKGSKKTFSREPNNLKNRNSFRYNGLIHKKTVGVEPCTDGKGVVLVTRNRASTRFPCKAFSKIELKRGSRRTLKTVRNVVGKHYRKDLKMAAVRRASAVLKSQKPVVISKRAAKPKKE